MTNIEKLAQELGQLKREVLSIRKMVITMVKEPIVIEQISEEKLTEEEKKSMNETMEDLKKGKKNKFVSLSELKKNT